MWDVGLWIADLERIWAEGFLSVVRGPLQGKQGGNETPVKNNKLECKECCVLSLDFKLRSAGFRPLLHFVQPIQHV